MYTFKCCTYKSALFLGPVQLFVILVTGLKSSHIHGSMHISVKKNTSKFKNGKTQYSLVTLLELNFGKKFSRMTKLTSKQ